MLACKLLCQVARVACEDGVCQRHPNLAQKYGRRHAHTSPAFTTHAPHASPPSHALCSILSYKSLPVLATCSRGEERKRQKRQEMSKCFCVKCNRELGFSNSRRPFGSRDRAGGWEATWICAWRQSRCRGTPHTTLRNWSRATRRLPCLGRGDAARVDASLRMRRTCQCHDVAAPRRAMPRWPGM